jgi:isoquinoline 1-oxidoreductase beta subunit
MLIDTAAQRWTVNADSCHAENGRVIHSGGRRFTYGELADDAARRPVPLSPALKPVSTFRVVGKPHKRVDTAARINGTARLGLAYMPEDIGRPQIENGRLIRVPLALISSAIGLWQLP